MKNLASNISKLNLQNYNINDHNTVEEEYDSDFNDVNENLGDLINEMDMFEYSNIGLDCEENSNNPHFFQLNTNAFRSACYFSTILNETDNIDDYILDLDSNFDDKSVISMTTNITNEIQPSKIPKLTNTTKFTSCVLIDNINGEIRSCGSSKNLHCIKNILGTWEIDNEMVHNVDGDLASLGVCYSHQMYDQTKLHVKNAKGTKDSSLGFINSRRCLFCNINKSFYTRRKQCDQHFWMLVGRNLQVPCSGQYHYTSLTNIHPILYPSLFNRKSRYICTSCYEKHSGHFHQRSGIKGKVSVNCQEDSSHKDDIIESLRLIGNWFLYIAKYESPNFQAELSHEAINLLQLLPSQRFNNTS
ncbi:16359_t:CDS:1 [Funneliformis geosporum]|uniref:16359_t:CDS:1 n=1 Tax=Funneliformis geosporum TaxID=1117311 RepID=A0A9W4WMH4_9GLOM|nr:16359_t:CDS:1 [Funneliformis geosporum]